MPKLIVYVKADTWRKVEAGYGLDAPALMRNLSVEAIEDFVAGLSERDETAASPVPDAPVVAHDSRSENRRPTPRECGMSNRHRMNTKQNPCPRCGYPA